MFLETDKPNPVNWYGVTKLRAEQLVQKKISDWSILRISTQYGLHDRRRNLGQDFLFKFLKGQEIHAAVDFYSSPTYVENTASMILEITEKAHGGIFHLCDTGRISRYEFALELAKSFDFELDKLSIKKISIKDLNWKAKRPIDSSLNNLKSQKILDTKPKEFVKGLEMFAKKFKEKK